MQGLNLGFQDSDNKTHRAQTVLQYIHISRLPQLDNN